MQVFLARCAGQKWCLTLREAGYRAACAGCGAAARSAGLQTWHPAHRDSTPTHPPPHPRNRGSAHSLACTCTHIRAHACRTSFRYHPASANSRLPLPRSCDASAMLSFCQVARDGGGGQDPDPARPGRGGGPGAVCTHASKAGGGAQAQAAGRRPRRRQRRRHRRASQPTADLPVRLDDA